MTYSNLFPTPTNKRIGLLCTVKVSTYRAQNTPSKIMPCCISQKFWLLTTVALLFVFDNYCPITDKLGSKDSPRKLQSNCAISFYFRLWP